MSVKLLAEQIVETYPNLKPRVDPEERYSWRTCPCSFAFCGPISSTKVITEVCHARARNYIGEFPDFITSLPCEDELSLLFIDLLLEYPFKNIKDHVSIETTDSGHHYLLVRDILKIPPQVFFNLAIASRTPLEHGHYYFRDWSKLAKAGINPFLAFLLSTHVLDKKDPNPLNWVFKNIGGDDFHFFISPNSRWDALLTGDYKINPLAGCTPCNEIWEYYSRGEIAAFKGQTVEKISQSFNLPINLDFTFPDYLGKTYEKH